MKVLLRNKLVKYEDNLYNKEGKISFLEGEKIKVNNKVKYIVPGFIDQHTHGIMGYDTMDNSIESLREITYGLFREGTTSFLPTTMTANLEDLDNVLRTIKLAKKENFGHSIVGAHLEGPFISPSKLGAQNAQNVQELSVENLKKLKNLDIIKMITYAPELDQEFKFTSYLKELEIVASVGHSNASAKDVVEAFKYGLCCFTHLHNASSSYSHRDAGVVTAAYLLDDAHKEIIADGIHVDEYTLKSTYKNLGANKINLVTDGMRAKGMEDGEYELGGLAVIKTGEEARLKEGGALAGSVLKMNNAIKIMNKLSECTLEEAFLMASYNQSKLFNLKNIGMIDQGYDFDITCLDENLNVIEVYKRGEKVYESSI